MPTLTDIINNCEYYAHGANGLVYKYKYNNNYFILKIMFLNDKMNKINKINIFKSIPDKYFYDIIECETKTYELFDKIKCKDINNKGIIFYPKLYHSGYITEDKHKKVLMNKLPNNIVERFTNHKIFYIITDYFDAIQLQDYLYKNINIEEIHIYLFYIIYYLYKINKKYIYINTDMNLKNILLIKDNEYEKNKIKYRKIKINKNIYKIKILQYKPIIIDFGQSSFINLNMYNKWLNHKYNNISQYININNKISIISNYNIIINIHITFTHLLPIFYYECLVKNNYNILNSLLSYCKKNNFNKLYDYIEFIKSYILIVDKYKFEYKNEKSNTINLLLSIFNDDDLFKFINIFKDK